MTEPSDVDVKHEWLDKNEHIIGALCQLIDTPLIDGVESLNTAKEPWEYLKKKIHQGGIATKLGALQAILAIHFTEPSTFSSTITEIKDHIATIYDDTAPTWEDWTIVFLLQALDGKHELLKENLMSFLTTSGTSLTSADIIAWIETKAQDTHMWETLSKHETVLAARQKGSKLKKPKAVCSNCSKTGHTLEKCWE